MKVTAYGTLLFFICLNLSLYLLNETSVLPNYEQSPYEEPAEIQSIFLNVSVGNVLLMAGTSLTIVAIIKILTGNFIFGGTVGLILFALQALFPAVQWILFGFPIFLGQIGVPFVITTIIQTLMAVVWAWFIIGFIGQRSTWEQ